MHIEARSSLQRIRLIIPRPGALQAILLGLSLMLIPGFTCRETIASQSSVLDDNHSSKKMQVTRVSSSIIKKMLWNHSASLPFQAPTLQQSNALSRAIEIAASMEDLSDIESLRTIAKDAGFKVVLWQILDQKFVALIEPSSNIMGLGAYLFRVSPQLSPRPLLLQAPHSYFDEGTGTLALRAFLRPSHETTPPRALFVNTKHRYIGEDGVKRKRKYNPADVCHNVGHAFNLATESFARTFPTLRVIQLHGFSNKKHKEQRSETSSKNNDHKSAAHTDSQRSQNSRMKVILSAGTIHSSPTELQILRDKLQNKIDFQFQLFPEDTKQLGATNNVQGRLLRRYPGSLFVHIEISKEARQSLKHNAVQFESFSIELLKAGLESG